MPIGAWHIKLGAELNTTLPDLGHPELPNLWNQLIDARPIRAGILECLAPHDCPRWMFPAQRGGHRYFAHYNPGELRQLAAKSDEHQARQDYLANRAQREGLTVATEVRRDGGRRIDVRISGTTSVACEVQTSYIHEGTVMRRTAIDARNGDTPLWIANDPYSAAINRAPWSRVPRSSPHRIAAGLDDLLLGGIMTASAERCGRREPNCPVTGRTPCGQLHLYFDPARGVHLDHLAIGAATGGYRPAVRKTGRALHHMWLTADDWDRWLDQLSSAPEQLQYRMQEPVGQPRELDHRCRYGEDAGIRSGPSAPRDSGARVFAGTVPAQRSHYTITNRCGAGTAPCGAPASLYPCGWRCEQHRPGHGTSLATPVDNNPDTPVAHQPHSRR